MEIHSMHHFNKFLLHHLLHNIFKPFPDNKTSLRSDNLQDQFYSICMHSAPRRSIFRRVLPGPTEWRRASTASSEMNA